MTGWAQIHGRRSLDSNWEEKFRLDVWYVDNQSFLLDMKILARTALKVLRRDDINQSGQATSEAFKGTGKDR
jgi:lipopolysaccharide/colanic/teichoic acid biosynthesis glycosyltransferase